VRGLKVGRNPNARNRERHRIALRILERARKHATAGDEVALSAITVAELEFGAHGRDESEAERGAVRRAIGPFKQLPFDADECATRYGAVRHHLEAAGKPIGSLDTLIAAHALALAATLVTNNTREFARVPGLKCENWVT